MNLFKKIYKLSHSLLDKWRRWKMNPIEYARSLGIKVGKGCFFSTKDFPHEGYLIEIGDNVRIAYGTSFYTHGGMYGIRKYYNDPEFEQFGKIKIGNFSSIGANCMIMPGVTIGENCIVGGGSIVTKSVPDGCMVAGNPAKFIGYTEDFYHNIKEKFDLQSSSMKEEEKKKFLLNLPEDKFVKKGFIKIPEKK